MKRNLTKLLCLVAALAMLTIGVVALAETEVDVAPEQIEQLEIATIGPEADAPEVSEDALYQEALTQLNKARQNSRLNSLKEELDGYVQDGELTQVQADLILNRSQEHIDSQQTRDSRTKGSGNGFGNGKKGGSGNRGGRR